MTGHRIVRSVVVALVIGATVACGGDDESSERPNQAGIETDSSSASADDDLRADVAISSCGVNEFGEIEATLRVTNSSSSTSKYIVDVVVEADAGSTELVRSVELIDDLGPGEVASEDVLTFVVSATNDFACRITDVSRFDS